ncbi:uncharacterized protein LOC124286137 [Haliotis rubra]|uniref:uncharacterized protein LOC124286137 n=1 Tax=Haliotis rubra TaxID=36100 RepID=UPI001EE63389|nr:uncharacterized protein LOC124286137 [Haliotis rubra]
MDSRFQPLFTAYAGLLPLGSVAIESKATYLDNSVWKCNLHCSPAYSVGMKGTTCYCLKEGYNTTKSMLSENTCPGNLEERCGNIQGMSVYKLGGFIGLGVGCLLLVLTVLIVVCLLRRHKKLCFEKRDVNQPLHFTSAAENITYGLASHAHTESEADAVISLPDTTDATSASSTVPTAIVRPSVHSDNININNAQVNDENEYNLLSTSNNSKVPMTHGNPYNHLSGFDGDNKYKGDYDTANFVPQTEEVTTGLKNTVTHPRLPDVSSGQEEEQYNVLGQHDSPRKVDAAAGVYDHVATDEGDYDTVGWGKNVSEVDDSYSHI